MTKLSPNTSPNRKKCCRCDDAGQGVYTFCCVEQGEDDSEEEEGSSGDEDEDEEDEVQQKKELLEASKILVSPFCIGSGVQSRVHTYIVPGL